MWGRSSQSCSSCRGPWPAGEEGRDRNQSCIALRLFCGPSLLLWIKWRVGITFPSGVTWSLLLFQWADSLWGEGAAHWQKQGAGSSRRGSSEPGGTRGDAEKVSDWIHGEPSQQRRCGVKEDIKDNWGDFRQQIGRVELPLAETGSLLTDVLEEREVPGLSPRAQ